MREGLRKIENERKAFSGIFVRYGTKTNWHGFPEQTILLKNVRAENGKVVTDHIWFTLTKGFQALGKLKEGNIIRFNARVKCYVKGYVSDRDFIDEQETDYKLSNPTKIEIEKVMEDDAHI